MSKRLLATIGLLLFLALWLRAPFIRAGLPYFYDEDEAHHYNRTVEMVQKGEFNPHYFLKPSLHFYLRMPIVAFSFIASARAGEIRSVKEIVTRDPFGLGGYSFSAFPTRILKWSRAYSVGWSLLTVFLCWYLASNLSGSKQMGILAALLVAVSPPLVAASATIGVDGIVCALVLLATILALRVYDVPKFWPVVFAGLCAGFAVSTKYNALPVALLPIAALLMTEAYAPRLLLAALLSPAVGFIAGTPFLFSDLPLFLDQVAYEILHYGVLGDIPEHTAEPGLHQALFYASWFSRLAIGYAAAITAMIGFCVLLSQRNRRMNLFLIFPVVYFALMVSQRVNYTRNMLVMIPYFAICAAFMSDWMRRRNFRSYILIAFSILLATQPLSLAIAARMESPTVEESRIAAAAWLNAHSSDVPKTAVAGTLQFDRAVFKISGVERIDLRKFSVADLKALGFGRVVIGQGMQLIESENAKAMPEFSLPGAAELQRIVNDPEIRIYRIQ